MDALWVSIDVIEARDALLQMKIGDYVKHMKRQDRSKLHRELYKKAFPAQKNYVDPKTLAKRLNDG